MRQNRLNCLAVPVHRNVSGPDGQWPSECPGSRAVIWAMASIDGDRQRFCAGHERRPGNLGQCAVRGIN
jgi:hypothetical protein